MPKRRPLLRPASPLQAQLRLVSLLDQLADLALYVSELERRVPGIQPSLFPEHQNITG